MNLEQRECYRRDKHVTCGRFLLHAPFLRQLLGLLCVVTSVPVAAVTLDAQNDIFGVPFAQPLLVEPDGLLTNDSVNALSAASVGAQARLVSPPTNGTLSCPGNNALELCPDGSFSYQPGNAYTGVDSFSYRFEYSGGFSNTATVELNACSGGPTIYSCWKEYPYLLKLSALGYYSFSEGFEESAWDVARSPTSVNSVTSKTITWSSNYTATNNITTGIGAAHSGQYGIFDPEHGSASGTSIICDVDAPPESCRYYDGVTGVRAAEAGSLHGVGAFFSGTYGANISVVLDAVDLYGMGALNTIEDQFFGVIDASPAGFSQFEWRETDGKLGQQLIIFADDFVFATESASGNHVPVANAGANREVVAGQTVILDASGSYDIDGDSLGYQWSFTSKPAASTATLSGATGVSPSFVADVNGVYELILVVNDGVINSSPATVVITANGISNTAPVADAGPQQGVTTGATVNLDGSGSSDADADSLSYSWSMTAKPAGSGASLLAADTVSPHFVADLDGSYTIQLMVSDGLLSSTADYVTVIASAAAGNSAPVANAGPPQSVPSGSTVQLDGSGSLDSDGDTLSYQWSLQSKPVGSGAVLAAATTAAPSFAADIAGSYVVQLIVSDGQLDSSPDSVVITANVVSGSDSVSVTDSSSRSSGGGGGALIWLVLLLGMINVVLPRRRRH